MSDVVQPDNTRREIIARAAEVYRSEMRQQLRLLAVGHGTALLFLFNARINGHLDVEQPAWLAGTFAGGLLFAYFAAHLGLGGERAEIAAITRGLQRKAHLEAQDTNGVRVGLLFLLSAGCFIAGLVWAIAAIGLSSSPQSRV